MICKKYMWPLEFIKGGDIFCHVYAVTIGASSGWGLAASRTNFVIRGLELAVPPSLLGRGKGVLQIESMNQ